MFLTRCLKMSGYLFGALFLFGVVTQIVSFVRPSSQQQAIEARRKEFSDLLQASRASPEAARELGGLYNQALDTQERLLKVAGRFMAGACTVVAGLLSAVAFLAYRIRVVRSLISKTGPPDSTLQATVAPQRR